MSHGVECKTTNQKKQGFETSQRKKKTERRYTVLVPKSTKDSIFPAQASVAASEGQKKFEQHIAEIIWYMKQKRNLLHKSK